MTKASVPNDDSMEESPEKAYFHALNRGEALVQCCEGCSRARFPPRTHCPHCGSHGYTWQKMNPEGVIYSYSHIPAIGEREAYNVVLVDLDDGFRMMSTCVGLLAGELQIGMRVVAGVEQDCSPARIIFRKAE